MLAISGINGMVGGALNQWFRAADFAVTGLSSRPVDNRSVELVNGVPAENFPARHVIHCGGLVGGQYSRDQYLRANVRVTENLLKWCEINEVEHFIFISTGGVYGPTEGWIDEKAPLNPQGDYCQSKSLAEEAVLASTLLKITVVRLYFPIGPFTRLHFFADLNRRLANGTAFLNDDDGHPWISPIDLNDIAPALAAVLRLELTGIYNLSGNVALSIREIASILSQVGNWPEIKPSDNRRPCGDFLGRADKIMRAASLGFRPTPEVLRVRAEENYGRL